MTLTPQQWNVEDYTRFAHFVPTLGQDLLGLLKPQKGEKILDLGCGEGSLTLKLMEAGAEVTGIDADAAMIEAAQKAGVDAQVMSATDMKFDQVFDAVFSNAALHWMKPPATVAQNIFRALKSDGRFIGEMGGKGNVESARSLLIAQLDKRGLRGAQYDPWYFPSAQEYAALLRSVGFEVRHMELYNRPTPLGDDVTGWLKTFGGSFTQALAEGKREAYINDVATQLRSVLHRENGQYILDYVRLRFVAVKTNS